MEFCDSLVTLPPPPKKKKKKKKSKMATKFRRKTGWPGNARTQLLRMIAISSFWNVMTNYKDCQRDFVKLLLKIFLLRKNKKFQILNIFFYFGPPLIWSLIKISKIPSDSPENFLLCNHCENIMPLLQTIIEMQHFPCLKIVKFCTLSNRSMKFRTSGKKLCR